MAELAGVNESKPSKKYDEQAEILSKPSYERSRADQYMLENDESIPSQGLNLPESLRPPTSDSLRALNERIGGPGEAETEQGRYAGRVGKNYGSQVAFGQVNPLPAVASGLAGQLAEENGAGPLLQAGVEIATILAGGKSGKKLGDLGKKQVKDEINRLRQLGYADEEITLAINRASKGKAGGVSASKGAKTENAFEQFTEKSNQLVSDILTQEIPGIDLGIKHVHQMASDAYGQVAKEASKLTIRNPTPFINSATGVVRELRKNLGKNPAAEPFLNRLHEAVIASTKSPSAENYMNFYKELNGLGSWMGRSQKDRLLTQVKNGIKDSFRSEGPIGRKFAEKFEKVNEGVSRAYDASEVHEMIQKATTQDGIDFNKLNKLYDKSDNVDLIEKTLGSRQSDNLHKIAKTGKEIKDFDKAWKASTAFSGNLVSDTLKSGSMMYLLYHGDYKTAGAVLGTKAASAGAKKLAEKSLTDPKFQNLWLRGLHAIKNESPKLFRSANQDMKKYLDDEGIEIE